MLARSGEEAIELLAVQTVDCILLDLLMPGLGGRRPAGGSRRRRRVRDIPLIMLTALEDRDGDDPGARRRRGRLHLEVERVRGAEGAGCARRSGASSSRTRTGGFARSCSARSWKRRRRGPHELAETRAVLVDELERKNDELEEANKELDAFSFSVSHDLRAPLRAITGFSNILMREHGEHLPPDATELLQHVVKSARRMDQLIEDLLRFSRLARQPLQAGRQRAAHGRGRARRPREGARQINAST